MGSAQARCVKGLLQGNLVTGRQLVAPPGLRDSVCQQPADPVHQPASPVIVEAKPQSSPPSVLDSLFPIGTQCRTIHSKGPTAPCGSRFVSLLLHHSALGAPSPSPTPSQPAIRLLTGYCSTNLECHDLHSPDPRRVHHRTEREGVEPVTITRRSCAAHKGIRGCGKRS